MSYLYVSKKEPKQSPQTLWFAIIAIVIIGAVIACFRMQLLSMFTSWWKGETNSIESSAAATHWFGDKVELAARITELENQNDDLSAQIAALGAKARAYDDLTGELIDDDVEVVEISDSSGTSTPEVERIIGPEIIDGTLAKIIRRPPFTAFDAYIIDQGSQDGIEVGDRAYTRNVPVGMVQNVTSTNATVRLYSSPGEKIVAAFGTSSMQFEAYGIGNGSLRADVPRDAKIAEGQSVTADDRAVSFIGTVTAVDEDSNSTNMSVFISLPFDISETGWFVIKKD